MVSDPIITNTIEITMATIGRLIKNFDIVSPLLRVRGGKRFRFHQSASPHFLDPFGDDRFAAIEPLRDNPVVVNAIADFYRTNTDLIFGVDDRDLISALKL